MLRNARRRYWINRLTNRLLLEQNYGYTPLQTFEQCRRFIKNERKRTVIRLFRYFYTHADMYIPTVYNTRGERNLLMLYVLDGVSHDTIVLEELVNALYNGLEFVVRYKTDNQNYEQAQNEYYAEVIRRYCQEMFGSGWSWAVEKDALFRLFKRNYVNEVEVTFIDNDMMIFPEINGIPWGKILANQRGEGNEE